MATPSAKKIILGNASTPIHVGHGSPLVFICGPCVIESRDHLLRHAEKLCEMAARLRIPLIFKSSYDKANRTSLKGFRGVGFAKGLELLVEVREKFGIPVLTDVHRDEEAREAGHHIDVLQVPAFLCRQTDLLLAAGATKKPVLVKKGQFLHPQDMQYVAEKIVEGGGESVMLCERGTCFGYRELVVDMRSLSMMSDIGWPVIFDATHSVQVMGGAGGSSTGNRRYVAMLARAAVAAGVDGLFLECHEDPDRAPSDGPNMLPISQVESLLRDLILLKQCPLETRSSEA